MGGGRWQAGPLLAPSPPRPHASLTPHPYPPGLFPLLAAFSPQAGCRRRLAGCSLPWCPVPASWPL
jgi:hypothetical protein